jgi:hypothetical protein
MIEYVVRITVAQSHIEDDGRRREYRSFKYLPAFNRRDAENMARALSDCDSGSFRKHGVDYYRSFDVVGMVRVAKGIAYLDVHTLEQIAEDMTEPVSIAAE